MGDLTKNFNRSDYMCPCGCGSDWVDYMLALVVQDIRDHFNKPVILNSATRCKSHNAEVGGGEDSQHLKGKAADVVVIGVPAKKVQEYVLNKYPNTFGIGRYNTFTHIDVRKLKARWDYRA